MNQLQGFWHHSTFASHKQPSRKMKASILAMFGLLALANAAPQYGYSNNFSGSKKPLTGSYSNCNVEWRTVKKAGYEEVTEYKEKTVYINVCKNVYQTECRTVKVCKHFSLLCPTVWMCYSHFITGSVTVVYIIGPLRISFP